MANTYRLVNPLLKGELKTSVKSDNSVEAGSSLYNRISEHFNNNVPEFYFTIQKGKSGNGKYYHFKVVEERTGNDVNFSIEPITIKNSKSKIERLEAGVEKARASEMVGGKKNRGKKNKNKNKKRDDDSDSDSESDDFYMKGKTVPVVSQPFYYWWYDPYVYSLDSFYIPTFYSYTYPYVEIVY